MKFLLICLILGLLIGFGTLFKLLAFSVIAVFGLPLIALLVVALLCYAAVR